eukprot:GHUV01017261.1.p1 GENE.GHUV01017261.1~~GHUV01017261.1.p1  ORF type:complete len:292 (+),score=76.77 GHUV01017261.1:540-1415(+)
MKLLASLGAGFDCASKAELEAVAALGVPKNRVIFAHPCKRASDLRYTRDAGVQMTTFDTESELHKVAAIYPGIQLVLRIRCDDPEAKCPLGLKYGANPADAHKLLSAASGLGLSVVGVSFHVGSGCKNLSTYSEAIATAKKVFDVAEELGHTMTILDIGGGFTGHFDAHGHVMFSDIARTINAAISVHFPPTTGVRIIAEPGRYFAETSAALIVPIYGKRDRWVLASLLLPCLLQLMCFQLSTVAVLGVDTSVKLIVLLASTACHGQLLTSCFRVLLSGPAAAVHQHYPGS